MRKFTTLIAALAITLTTGFAGQSWPVMAQNSIASPELLATADIR